MRNTLRIAIIFGLATFYFPAVVLAALLWVPLLVAQQGRA